MNPKSQNNKIQIPSLDEIIKNNPPVQVDNIEYENEDEEEELDTMFPLSEFERKYEGLINGADLDKN